MIGLSNTRPYFSQGLLTFYEITATDSLIFCNDTGRVCWTEERKKGTGLDAKYSELVHALSNIIINLSYGNYADKIVHMNDARCIKIML